jgi:hypothetical protein
MLLNRKLNGHRISGTGKAKLPADVYLPEDIRQFAPEVPRGKLLTSLPHSGPTAIHQSTNSPTHQLTPLPLLLLLRRVPSA